MYRAVLVILVCVVEEIYFWRLFTDWIAGFFFQLQTQSSSRIASEKAKNETLFGCLSRV